MNIQSQSACLPTTNCHTIDWTNLIRIRKSVFELFALDAAISARYTFGIRTESSCLLLLKVASASFGITRQGRSASAWPVAHFTKSFEGVSSRCASTIDVISFVRTVTNTSFDSHVTSKGAESITAVAVLLTNRHPSSPLLLQSSAMEEF